MTLFDWFVLIVALAAFLFNGRRRVAFNRVWNASVKGIAPPETMPTYDAAALTAFINAAKPLKVGRTPALEYYAKHLLTESDICFAIGLTLATIDLWWHGAIYAGARCPFVVWLAWPCCAMAVIYLAADISEDLKLSAILWHGKLWHVKARAGGVYPQRVDRAEAAAANMLTRIKLVSLGLSLGWLIYLVPFLIQTAFEKWGGQAEPRKDLGTA